MRVEEYLRALRRDGELFAAAATAADPDAPVPSCPEWRLRDLVRHLGGVHRWATTHVTAARGTVLEADDDLERLVGGWPPDADLPGWFRLGHAALVDALDSAPDDLACWTFLPAPSPRAFWARRQAHETAVHRADAEAARGTVTPFPADFAADGLDELLLGFAGRRRAGVTTATERTLSLRATDLDACWHVRLTPGDPGDVAVERRRARAECSVQGTASDLYLLMWNRRRADGLRADGDAAVLDAWREGVRITWS